MEASIADVCPLNVHPFLEVLKSLKPPGPKMGVTHVVFFEFNSSASPGVINDACPLAISDNPNLTKFRWLKISRRMLALKDGCIHPTSKKPYIKSASGGTDNSPEGLQVPRLDPRLSSS